MELTKKQVLLLDLLGFKHKSVSSVDGRDISKEMYFHKKFKNGDHLSICLTDKTHGGSFGGKDWEIVEVECEKIIYVLKEEGLL